MILKWNKYFHQSTIKLLLIVLYIIINGGIVTSYKILGVSISTMKSQHIFFSSLMKGLAIDGNDVTFISPYKYSKPIKNLREILFDNTFDINNSEGVVKSFDIFRKFK